MAGEVGRRPMIAVVGAGAPSAELYAEAEKLGRGLVSAGFRIVCGGRRGVMEAVGKGAHASALYREGDVVGVLPGTSAEDANRWMDIVLPTGLGHARNVVVACAGDAVIVVGGGAGTLSEVAMAWVHDRPIVALDMGEGWSARARRGTSR